VESYERLILPVGGPVYHKSLNRHIGLFNRLCCFHFSCASAFPDTIWDHRWSVEIKQERVFY